MRGREVRRLLRFWDTLLGDDERLRQVVDSAIPGLEISNTLSAVVPWVASQLQSLGLHAFSTPLQEPTLVSFIIEAGYVTFFLTAKADIPFVDRERLAEEGTVSSRGKVVFPFTLDNDNVDGEGQLEIRLQPIPVDAVTLQQQQLPHIAPWKRPADEAHIEPKRHKPNAVPTQYLLLLFRRIPNDIDTRKALAELFIQQQVRFNFPELRLRSWGYARQEMLANAETTGPAVVAAHCSHCQKISLSQCARCNTPYCSTECQRRDWPVHRAGCTDKM
jgi:hypothetical protein